MSDGLPVLEMSSENWGDVVGEICDRCQDYVILASDQLESRFQVSQHTKNNVCIQASTALACTILINVLDVGDESVMGFTKDFIAAINSVASKYKKPPKPQG